MAMTIAVTRNTPGRFRGFLASCMLEIAPGVYVAPRMPRDVRERVWQVLLSWAELIPPDGGVVLLWAIAKHLLAWMCGYWAGPKRSWWSTKECGWRGVG